MAHHIYTDGDDRGAFIKSTLIKPHFFTLLALFVLTIVTYLASLPHLGEPLADLVALAIAVAKVALVVGIFMHVKGSSPLILVTAVSGFFWVLLFFAYLVADVKTRDMVTVFPGW
ncbi:MAG: cytochrome C oxidase subunit IV family protein [Acidobacteriota bacterium]